MHFSINVAQLNIVEDILPILVGMPGQSKVQLIYRFGPPNVGLMTDETNFLLGLIGEADDKEVPDITSVPNNAFETVLANVVTESAFEAEMLKKIPLTPYPCHNKKHLNNDEIPQATLIPAYVVAGGFEDDLDIDMVYERIQLLCSKTDYGIQVLQFLRGLVTPSTEETPSAHIDASYFSTRATKETKLWRKTRIQALLLKKQVTTMGPPVTNTPLLPPMPMTDDAALRGCIERGNCNNDKVACPASRGNSTWLV